MRSPITFIAAVLAALLCAVPALAGKPHRTTTTTTTTSTVAPAPAPAPAPTVNRTVPLRTDGQIPIGFNVDYSLTRIWADSATATPWVGADADASAAAGATVSRTPLYWKGVQPTQSAWNWGTYDRIINAYAARGMRVIVNVSGTPDWAKLNCGTGCLFNTANLADFSAFVTALANRYGTRLAGIEVYNEPNSAKYWGGPADPELYKQILCAGYSGAQAASVRLPIAGGSLAPNMATVNGDIRMDVYLSRMLQAGATPCMDVISFHPYPGSTDLTSSTSMFQKEFAQIRALRDYYKPSMRLWVTETGLSLATAGVTQAVQATTIPAIYDTIAAMPQKDVDVVVIHTLVQSSGTLSYGLGQLVADAAGAPSFVPTPAYVALQGKFLQGR
ncbi:MAG TPA: cellulase family glycosylhydrolase [Thermoleophilaceae bacterium]|nr:cellulase family glycosylhydrolase [Thermoleophilaceae bacterium]